MDSRYAMTPRIGDMGEDPLIISPENLPSIILLSLLVTWGSSIIRGNKN
jgi:hypothetical protein